MSCTIKTKLQIKKAQIQNITKQIIKGVSRQQSGIFQLYSDSGHWYNLNLHLKPSLIKVFKQADQLLPVLKVSLKLNICT